MNRPEVRIIEPQQYSEPQQVNISSAEAYALMAKYNVNTTQPNIQSTQTPYDPYQNLTFDEMVAMEEQKNRITSQQKEMERMREMNKPTPYSFDRGSIKHHETQYKSIEDTNIGIEVKVVTNMDINKGYGY